MAKTYLGVWSTYWYTTNTGTPYEYEDFRGRWKFYYEQNQAALTSTITVEYYIQIYSNEYIQAGYIPPSSSRATVNGTSSTKSNNALNVPIAKGYSERLIGTSTFTIQHDSNGKANLVFSGRWIMSGTTRNASHTWALPDIQLASSIASDVSEQTLGSQIQFTITPKEPTYIHVLKYKYGTSGEIQIATNVGTSYNWTPSVDLAQYVTNNTYGTATIYCYSYDGSVSDENYKGVSSINVRLNIPDSVKPTGTLTVTDVNTTNTSETGKVPSAWGILVKGYSKLQLQASLTMAQGATLTSILMTACDGQGGTTNPFTSPQNVATSGTSLANTCFVTDSRGKNATITTNSNIYDYENPSGILKVIRANSDGTYNANGTNAKATLNYQISSLNNNNLKQYILKYRAKGASTYTNIESGTLSSYNGVLEIIISNITFDTGTTYEFLAEIVDQFNTTPATATMAYSRKPISVKKTKGVTFGRHAVDDGFNVYYDADFKMNISRNGNPIPSYKILYNNSTGSNGTIQLSDLPSNYSCIEIFAIDNNSTKGGNVKVDSPTNGSWFTVFMIEAASSSTFIRRTKYTITDDTLVPSNLGYSRIMSSSADTTTGTNYIYITKVVGWL